MVVGPAVVGADVVVVSNHEKKLTRVSFMIEFSYERGV